MAPPLFVADASRAAVGWARQRHLGLTSATGISVVLAGCAAVWFSAGATADMFRGAVALWCSYLVLAAGRLVARRVGGASEEAADRRMVGPVRWLAALGLSLAEVLVYAGLVVGAEAEHSPGMWTIGVGVLGLVTVRTVMTACSTPYGLRYPPETLVGRGWAAVLTMAAGARILVIGMVAPVFGPRAVLLVMLAWAISSVAYGLAGRPVPDVAAETAGDGSAVASASLLRMRDDGLFARYLGALVRGVLLPLPPAILALAAVSALALVGMHGLPGPLMLGPAVAMLLAAPGSGNPHVGRFDWLAPVLIVSSQILYLSAVGAGGRVPGPVSYVLVAALLIRYTDLACAQRPVMLARQSSADSARREFGTELGWEGRVLLAGFGAAIGIATVGYVALTGYLALLIGAKVVRCGVESSPDEEQS
ncbi:MAG: hypothetical protein J2P29_02315 [Actinobacteria bacterium]|nr:hypothetical protein [Actinomycetota bacterium]